MALENQLWHSQFRPQVFPGNYLDGPSSELNVICLIDEDANSSRPQQSFNFPAVFLAVRTPRPKTAIVVTDTRKGRCGLTKLAEDFR